MKKITHLAIFCFMLLSLLSCKSKKDTTATSKSTTQAAATNTNSTPAVDSYRLVVAFFSIGQGIDVNAKDAFVKFLDSYSKKIAYEPTHWGREGEIDYCLKLSELSTSEQADFVKKAIEMLNNSQLVHISENTQCVNKH